MNFGRRNDMKPYNRTRQVAIQFCSILLWILFIALFGSAQSASKSPPETAHSNNVNSSVQAQMSAAIGADEPAYRVMRHGRGYRLNNEHQVLSAEFTAAGVDVHQR